MRSHWPDRSGHTLCTTARNRTLIPNPGRRAIAPLTPERRQRRSRSATIPKTLSFQIGTGTRKNSILMWVAFRAITPANRLKFRYRRVKAETTGSWLMRPSLNLSLRRILSWIIFQPSMIYFLVRVFSSNIIFLRDCLCFSSTSLFQCICWINALFIFIFLTFSLMI